MIPALLLQTAGPAEEIASMNVEILDYVKLLLVLGGVLLLAYVSLRFWLPKFSGLRAAPSGPIQVVGRLALEPKKTLFVVKTGPDFFLIGTSESEIHYLTALDAEALAAQAAAPPAAPGTDFRQLLGKFRRTAADEKGVAQ